MSKDNPTKNESDYSDFYDHPKSPVGTQVLRIPPPPGWFHHESVTVADLPAHISRQVGSASERGKGHEVLAHYSGFAEGSGIADKATSKRLGELARGLASAANQSDYFAREIRPFLQSVKPQRRTKA